jgi:SHS2 domain-containing protein
MSQPSYKWEPSPHTADLAIAIEAEEIADLFRAAFDGLLGLLEIPPGDSMESEILEHVLSMKFCAIEEGLVDFLNECIYLMDGEDLVPFRIGFLEYEPGELNAKFQCRQVADLERPRITHIKAATYSGLTVEQVGDVYRAKIIFDT